MQITLHSIAFTSDPPLDDDLPIDVQTLQRMARELHTVERILRIADFWRKSCSQH